MSTKLVISFVFGVAIGAVSALLLAPKSGEELRAQLAHEAQADRERLREEYTRAVGDVQERLDKVQGDVQATLEHLKERGVAAATDPTAE